MTALTMMSAADEPSVRLERHFRYLLGTIMIGLSSSGALAETLEEAFADAKCEHRSLACAGGSP